MEPTPWSLGTVLYQLYTQRLAGVMSLYFCDYLLRHGRLPGFSSARHIAPDKVLAVACDEAGIYRENLISIFALLFCRLVEFHEKGDTFFSKKRLDQHGRDVYMVSLLEVLDFLRQSTKNEETKNFIDETLARLYWGHDVSLSKLRVVFHHSVAENMVH